MVIKKEGATLECKNCDTELICRLKKYEGFADALQWQNYDGTAHYKTTDGKNFTCNIPTDDEQNQTRITSPPDTVEPPTTTPGDTPPTPRLVTMENKIDILLHETELVKGMVEPLFKKMVDEQLENSKK